jgi:hypothetical protein
MQEQPLTRIFVPDPGRFGLKRKGSVTPIGYRLKHLARCYISDKGPQVNPCTPRAYRQEQR